MAAISTLVLNDTFPQKDRSEEVDTPTTPRPGRFASNSTNEPSVLATDPALQSSSAVIPRQRPRQGAHTNSPSSQDAHPVSTNHPDSAMMDSMDLSDDEPDGSDNDADGGEGDSASRKKKGQRFFCTGYPPCNLTFTRSEHLARHIRKHTGERPFQCHCNRRFSRLDNLRQHAQTVHVNEEIPTDSLAATGTRFQRQIRTDRVRPTGRPRTGTGSSAGGHARGHSRNLSASSIGSTSSNYSIVTDAKRRPPPLLMANDANRSVMGIDRPQTPPTQYRPYEASNGSGLSTPTSTNFSATPGSPGFLSSMGSPTSTHSRTGSFIGSRPHTRRLSVPSGLTPYQHQYPSGYPMTYMNHIGPVDSHPSSNSSAFPSPTSATFPVNNGQYIPPGEDWRRRTWHPSTFPAANLNYGRPATSGLTYSQTPDAPQPAHAQHATAAAGQAPRLPGIESFDHVQHRSYTPPRRQPSPMQLDAPPADTHSSGPAPYPDRHARPGHVSWEAPRRSQYPELEDHLDRNPTTATWGQQTIHELHSVSQRNSEVQRPMEMRPPPASGVLSTQPPHLSRDKYETQSSGRNGKRQAWYNGPIPTARTSPEDSSSSDGVPTPGMTAVDVHPLIMNSNGFVEPQQAAIHADGHQNVCLPPSSYIDTGRHHRTASFTSRGGQGGEMNRLEALVAVATSGENTR